jgi:hypothetical protein
MVSRATIENENVWEAASRSVVVSVLAVGLWLGAAGRVQARASAH